MENQTNGNGVSTPIKKKPAAKKAVKKVAKKASKKAAPAGDIKAKVIRELKKGVGPTEAARRVGCSLTTARYHAKRMAKAPFSKREIKKLASNVRVEFNEGFKLDLIIDDLEKKLATYKELRELLAPKN